MAASSQADSIWQVLLASPAFRRSCTTSYLVNLAFGLSINVGTTWGESTIPVFADLQKDVASAFLFSACFCGLLTPLLSSCGILRAVKEGKAPRISDSAVSQSWSRFILEREVCTRSLLIAFGDTLVFGIVACLLGGAAGQDTLPVWSFLILLCFWAIPIQLVTSLLNYAAVVHLARGSSPAFTEEGVVEVSMS
ncbi:unnamed protein product [Polarella glacialis]|uniref:Uncharacterized protein n=2 Tax=Polarella glacialis TaxID=89957 RepID=A0A813FNW6_POLGL|nr:unnamed protein product [Polarella glacialis]